MDQKPRNRRRGPSNDRPAAPQTNANGGGSSNDRYTKFLPEWMRGTNGAPQRPARPRRSRSPRPAGGYTPGKFAKPGPLD